MTHIIFFYFDYVWCACFAETVCCLQSVTLKSSTQLARNEIKEKSAFLPKSWSDALLLCYDWNSYRDLF